MQYLLSYPVAVPAWVLQDSSGATSKEQRYYFYVGTSVVTVFMGYCIAGYSNLAVYTN